MRRASLIAALLLAAPAHAAPSRCALVSAGVVVNVAVCDPASFAPPGLTVVASATAQIGWTYAGGVFTPVTPAIVYQTSGLTYAQFWALFTTAEQTAIVSSTDVNVRQFLLQMAGQGGGFINLGDPSIATALNYAVSIGLLTSARAAVVLTGAPHS